MKRPISLPRILILFSSALALITGIYFVYYYFSNEIIKYPESVICVHYGVRDPVCFEGVIGNYYAAIRSLIIKLISIIFVVIGVPWAFNAVEKRKLSQINLNNHNNLFLFRLCGVSLAWLLLFIVGIRLVIRMNFVTYNWLGGSYPLRNIVTFQCDDTDEILSQWYHIGPDDLIYRLIPPCPQPQQFLMPKPL